MLLRSDASLDSATYRGNTSRKHWAQCTAELIHKGTQQAQTPHFILYVLSQSERKSNTRNIAYKVLKNMIQHFSCIIWAYYFGIICCMSLQLNIISKGRRVTLHMIRLRQTETMKKAQDPDQTVRISAASSGLTDRWLPRS